MTPLAHPASLGVLCGLSSYLIWGLLPLYWTQLSHIAAERVLAYRILWSLPCAMAMVLTSARWRTLAGLLARPGILLALACSSFLICVNWVFFVYGVSHARLIEVSFGYFLNPLVNFLLGTILFGETFSRTRIAAIVLAGLGVLVQASRIETFPIIGLALCGTFAAYGALHKKIDVDVFSGFFVEIMLAIPLGAGLLLWSGSILSQTPGPETLGLAPLGPVHILIALSGPLTALPLLLFVAAAKRVSLSMLGMMQFIAPSLHLMIALLLGEPFALHQMISFSLIWLGIIVFFLNGRLSSSTEQRP